MPPQKSDCTAVSEVMRNALLTMGWNLDAPIPMANAENMAMALELEETMSERAILKSNIRELDRRCEKLTAHRQHAEGIAKCNQKLIQAFKAEDVKQTNAIKVLHRQIDKSLCEAKGIDKSMSDMSNQLERLNAETVKRKASISKLTSCISWAKNALIEWEAAMEDGNRGYQLIQKYFKDDQVLAQHRDKQRQALQKEIDRTQKELVMIYDERQVLEKNLNGIAKLYRKAHEERRSMVDTWKGAVRLMATRENDIYRMEAELEKLKEKSAKTEEELKKYNNELTEVADNNREIESTIEEINSETSDLRAQMQTVSDMIKNKEVEVEVIQRELQNLANFVEVQRAENRKNSQEKQRKIAEIESYNEVLKELLKRLDFMKRNNMTAQERMQILEDMNQVEDVAIKDIKKEIFRINGLESRAQSQRVEFKSEVRRKQVENAGLIFKRQAIAKSILATEKCLQRQTEIHYQTGFKCLELERAIVKMQGGLLDPEHEQRIEAYLRELEQQYQIVSKRLQATEAQNHKLNHNMRTLTHVFNIDVKVLDTIHYNVKEAQLYFEGGVKRLKAEKAKARMLIVEYSIMKMRVNEFENELKKCNNTAFNLAKHRAHLNRTISARMIEIKSQMELLVMKRKYLNEEKGTLRADVSERNKRIEAVRARFALATRLLGTNEDGSLVTATQLRVQAAQEKQMLLEEGNELNERVLRAEKEIKAMENTLVFINHANEGHKQQMMDTLEDASEQQACFELKAAYLEHLNLLKTIRQSVDDLEAENSAKTDLVERLENQLIIENQKSNDLREMWHSLNKELDSQVAKIQRAEREVKRSLKLLKQRAISEEFLTLFKRDLDLTDMESRNLKALNHIVDLAQHEQQACGQRILKLLVERGITLPHHMKRTRSTMSWRSNLSDFSNQSSKDLFLSSTRSSLSEGAGGPSTTRTDAASVVVSVVSIDFPGPKNSKSKFG